MCLCDPCDAAVEATLKGKFLNELCDCDIFTRWICRKCVKAELEFTWDYYKKHTKGEWESEDYEAECERTKTMGDHQHSRHVSNKIRRLLDPFALTARLDLLHMWRQCTR